MAYFPQGLALALLSTLSTIALAEPARPAIVANPALPDYTIDYFLHDTPYIPPQCYSKSIARHSAPATTNSPVKTGDVTNPCYSCHTQGKRPNVLNDSGTQLNFTFLGAAQTNPWQNLFVDRRAQIAAIADLDILQYVQYDNYLTAEGAIAINERIKNNIAAFDVNKNGQWDGYTPDAYFRFDSKGFDRTPSDGFSGWRSFAYYPFMGAFMPTNGSTDDVLIRLPKIFQNDETGEWSQAIYEINFAIVEALIKEKNIPIAATDENTLGIDLNKNGKLDTANQIVYEWAPLQHKNMSYVGAAKIALATKKVHLAAKLYPEGTEFLHTVRYLDVSPEGNVGMAKRMKELRYARKKYWVTYFGHETIAGIEIKERHDFPDRPKTIIGTPEEGVEVSQGWVYQGFIEDAQGDLRPQTFEEHAFCVGCHSGTGVLIDSSFAFYRKFSQDQFQQGWYHWSQKALAAIAEPRRASDGEYEYSFYLKHNPSGDEYGSNTEVLNKFYNAEGKPKSAAFNQLHSDIGYLLTPSPTRALALNKAYRLIVQEQSFNRGRDAVLAPLKNVHKFVEQDQATGITTPLNFY